MKLNLNYVCRFQFPQCKLRNNHFNQIAKKRLRLLSIFPISTLEEKPIRTSHRYFEITTFNKMTTSSNLHITDIIGSYGIYQTLLITWNFILGIHIGSTSLFIELSAPEVDIYWNWDLNGTVFKSTDCRTQDIMGMWNTSSNYSNSSTFLIYETKYSRNTLTERLDLVCEKSWIISLAKSLFLVSGAFGNFITGRLCEKYGRRRVMIFLLFVNLISNLILQFPQSWIMLVVGSFVSGLCWPSATINTNVQLIEVIPVYRRQFYGHLTRSGSIVGQIIICGVAWISKDWFYVQLFQVICSAVCFILSCFVIESPIWLMVRNRPQEAEKNITRIVQINQLHRQEANNKIEDWIQQMKSPQDVLEQGKFSDLFMNITITKYTLCITVVTFSITILNFGLTMNIGSFGSDLHLDILVTNGLSMFMVLLTILFMKKISVKDVHTGSLLLCGIACAAYPIFYEYDLARTVISAIGRASTSAVVSLVFFYSAEIFPTSVRVVGSSFASLVTRSLSALCPFTKELAEKTTVYAPFILFAAISFFGFMLNLFLPETKGKPLVQTVKELNQKENRRTSPPVFVITTKL